MALDTIIKQPIKRIVLTATALIALTGIAYGANITGKIVDLNTKNPIQGVKVKFVGSVTDSAKTDVNGDYSKSLTDGIYEVLVGGKSQYISFDAKSDTLIGDVRRNVAMIDTGATATQLLEMRGTDKTISVFQISLTLF